MFHKYSSYLIIRFVSLCANREAWAGKTIIKGIWSTDEITSCGKMPSPNVGGPLSVIRILDVRDINIKAEACNLHCGMIWFATLLHDRELQEREPRCASSFWQKEWLSRIFTTAGLGQLNLFSSTLGMMVWPGIKMIQTEYRLVSVGVSVGPAIFLQKHAKARFKHAWAVWKAPQKAHKKERKWNPIWNWWPLFISTWIKGYRFWGVPCRLCRFHELLQSSMQLLTTLFNFVGYSYKLSFRCFY